MWDNIADIPHSGWGWGGRGCGKAATDMTGHAHDSRAFRVSAPLTSPSRYLECVLERALVREVWWWGVPWGWCGRQEGPKSSANDRSPLGDRSPTSLQRALVRNGGRQLAGCPKSSPASVDDCHEVNLMPVNNHLRRRERPQLPVGASEKKAPRNKKRESPCTFQKVLRTAETDPLVLWHHAAALMPPDLPPGQHRRPQTTCPPD